MSRFFIKKTLGNLENVLHFAMFNHDANFRVSSIRTVHVNVDSKSKSEAEVIYEEDEKVQEAGNGGTRQKTTNFRPHWAKWYVISFRYEC